MTFSRVAVRRERQHVPIVIQSDRLEKFVHAADEFAVARPGGAAHLNEQGMLKLAREADAHVVGDAGFAGRIDDARGKFRDERARLQAGATFQADEFARRPKFFQRVEHVEVHNARDGQPALARKPREL